MSDVLDPYQYFVFSKCHATHAKEDWILKIHLPSPPYQQKGCVHLASAGGM